MKSMMKDAAILVVITVIAGLLLGGVYQITQNPIAMAEEKATKEAYNQVFAQASEFEMIENKDMSTSLTWAEEGYAGVQIDAVLRALDKDGSKLGYVLKLTSHEGYGGDITFTMGIGNDGSINGISILKISETAGLGMKAESVLVPQFADKKVEKFSLTKGGAMAEAQIDAISGATITSNAFVTAANAGLYFFKTELGGDKDES